MRNTLAVLLIVVFVSITLFAWFPPTYEGIIGYTDKDHSFVTEPIYGTKIEIKNLMLNLLPWIFFVAYLIASKKG